MIVLAALGICDYFYDSISVPYWFYCYVSLALIVRFVVSELNGRIHGSSLAALAETTEVFSNYYTKMYMRDSDEE